MNGRYLRPGRITGTLGREGYKTQGSWLTEDIPLESAEPFRCGDLAGRNLGDVSFRVLLD